jgi:hypothetical protein
MKLALWMGLPWSRFSSWTARLLVAERVSKLRFSNLASARRHFDALLNLKMAAFTLLWSRLIPLDCHYDLVLINSTMKTRNGGEPRCNLSEVSASYQNPGSQVT